MNLKELMTTVRKRLRDVWADPRQRLWDDQELVDYANAARDRLFFLTRTLIMDSTTADDGATPPLPVCRIAVKKGVSKYALSNKVIEIARLKLASETVPAVRVMQSELDTFCPGWETLETAAWTAWCPDLESDSVTLIPIPQADDTAILTVSRLPLKRLTMADLTADLGFREEYHEDLIPWILYLAYSKKDPETNQEHSAEADYQRKVFMDRVQDIRAELHRRMNVPHTITPRRGFL